MCTLCFWAYRLPGYGSLHLLVPIEWSPLEWLEPVIVCGKVGKKGTNKTALSDIESAAVNGIAEGHIWTLLGPSLGHFPLSLVISKGQAKNGKKVAVKNISGTEKP